MDGTGDVKVDGNPPEMGEENRMFHGVVFCSSSKPDRVKGHGDLEGGKSIGDNIAAICEMETTKDNVFAAGGFEDMTAMDKLNDAELARNLSVLYANKACYCWCGAALVAMNLMEPLDIFNTRTLRRYQQSTNPRVEEKPHVWGVASGCYNKLFEPKIVMSGAIGASAGVLRNHQAIIITGESGAGKSYTTKKVLDFIAAAGNPIEDSADISNSRASVGSKDKMSITTTMLNSGPILEAFGNSGMPRNDDSSRFGKLYKVFFQPSDRHITGCEIEPYLLEKSRVSAQQIGERNYHIFYRMILGLSEERRAALHLRPCKEYTYLKLGSAHCSEDAVPPMDNTTGIPRGWSKYKDRDGMADTDAALHAYFDTPYADNVLKITAGVLTLGNIDLEEDENGMCRINKEFTGDAIKHAAELLQVEEADLEEACSSFARYSNKKWTSGKTSISKAMKFRDAMARDIYSKMFEQLVDGFNQRLKTPEMNTDPSGDIFLGVLDIFGFEFVKEDLLSPSTGIVNSFEQFCINLCNEQLQKNFIAVVFGFEEKMYAEELGTDRAKELVKLEYESNDSTLDMMQKPMGRSGNKSVFGLLDEESKRGKDDSTVADQAFYGQIDTWIKSLKKAKNDPVKERLLPAGRNYGKETRNPMGFRVKHYAGEVVYDCGDWVDKNADKLSYDVYKCLGNSRDELIVRPLFREDFDAHAKGPVKAGKTVAASFRMQLQELAHTLDACECEFIRCIKTNREKVKCKFEPDLVLTQLNYTGMLATLKVRKQGYEMRLPFEAFRERYHMLQQQTNDTVEQLVTGIKDKDAVDILKKLQDEGKSPPASQTTGDHILLGLKGRVLARGWLMHGLDVKRQQKMQDSLRLIRLVWSASRSRKEMLRVKECYLRIIPELHNYINKKRAKEEGDKSKKEKEEAEARIKEAKKKATEFALEQAKLQQEAAVQKAAETGVEVAAVDEVAAAAAAEKVAAAILEKDTTYQDAVQKKTRAEAGPVQISAMQKVNDEMAEALAEIEKMEDGDAKTQKMADYEKERKEKVQLAMDKDAKFEPFLDENGVPMKVAAEDGQEMEVGKLIYQAGSRKHRKEYMGQVDEAHYPNGKGRMEWERKTQYDGEWKADKPHGKGTYKWPSGNQYEGQFKNGKKHGTGKFTTPDGNTYDGEWQFDNAHGHGVFDTPEGDKYEGEFSIDMKDGHGKMTFANHDIYDGAWEQDKRNGFGVFTTESGDRYEGQFMDDKLHGKGVMTSKDGYMFSGYYKDGKRDGDGEMTLPNGTKISGKWVNDVRVDKKRKKKKTTTKKEAPATSGANKELQESLAKGKEEGKANPDEAPQCGCTVS